MGCLPSSPAHEECEERPWTSPARRATDAGTYCVLCGSPFDLLDHMLEINPPGPHFRIEHNWLHDFRILGSTKTLGSHQLGSQTAE